MTNDPDSGPSDQCVDIRPSPIAGLWYSNSPQHLSKEIDTYLEVSLPRLDGTVMGLIAPHAGYRYSGQTAGYAFKTVKGVEFDLVVVLSPLHAYHNAALLTSVHQAYKTPLGTVPIDEQALQSLEQSLAKKAIRLARISHDGEHSIEIELPFLQRALEGSFLLLPLMVRTLDSAVLQQIAASLSEIIAERNVLLVASTDLSHFYSLDTARQFDGEMLHQMEAFSPEGVLSAERKGKGFACGAGAVALALWAARQLGADAVEVLNYSTSADETDDRSSVVGYGAAVILKRK